MEGRIAIGRATVPLAPCLVGGMWRNKTDMGGEDPVGEDLLPGEGGEIWGFLIGDDGGDKPVCHSDRVRPSPSAIATGVKQGEVGVWAVARFN